MQQRRSVPLLRAVVTNDLPFVLATRKYLGDLILACFHDKPEDLSYAEKLSTASAELLENAFKYSPPGTNLLVRLSRTADDLVLQVGNALREEARQVLSCVRQEIGSVWAELDAREAFRKKVMASLADPKSKAMLGYSKIRMETGGRLRARLGTRGRLDITLTFPLSPPPPAVR
jgi:hypothetical protein